MVVKFKDRHGIRHWAVIALDQKLIDDFRHSPRDSDAYLFIGTIKIASVIFDIAYHRGFIAIPGVEEQDDASANSEIPQNTIALNACPSLTYYDRQNHKNWICETIATLWCTVEEKPSLKNLWDAISLPEHHKRISVKEIRMAMRNHAWDRLSYND